MAKAKYLKFQDSEVLVDYATTTKQDINGKVFKSDYSQCITLKGNYQLLLEPTGNLQLVSEDATYINNIFNTWKNQNYSSIVFTSNNVIALVTNINLNSKTIEAIYTNSTQANAAYNIDNNIIMKLIIENNNISWKAYTRDIMINLDSSAKLNTVFMVQCNSSHPSQITYILTNNSSITSAKLCFLSYQETISSATGWAGLGHFGLYYFFASDDYTLSIFVPDDNIGSNRNFEARLYERKCYYDCMLEFDTYQNATLFVTGDFDILQSCYKDYSSNEISFKNVRGRVLYPNSKVTIDSPTAANAAINNLTCAVIPLSGYIVHQTSLISRYIYSADYAILEESDIRIECTPLYTYQLGGNSIDTTGTKALSAKERVYLNFRNSTFNTAFDASSPNTRRLYMRILPYEQVGYKPFDPEDI